MDAFRTPWYGRALEHSPPRPPEVHSLEQARLLIALQWEIIQQQQPRIEALEAELGKLRALLEGRDDDAPKTPPWVKPNKPPRRRRKKKGPKKGHEPAKRTVPERIDEVHEHELDGCPACGGELGGAVDVQTHVDIELPPIVPIVREHVLLRYWCPCCKKLVRSCGADVVPRSKYGPRLHVFVSWLKFGLGVTLQKIQALLWELMGLRISTGVLSEMVSRTGERLAPSYDELVAVLREQSVLYADESGWRVDGVNHYLWVFTNDDLAGGRRPPSTPRYHGPIRLPIGLTLGS